jgi:predicted ATPase
MLKRLFIDNFPCFVNFEFRPERQQLIVGRNGTRKSSFMDALMPTVTTLAVVSAGLNAL